MNRASGQPQAAPPPANAQAYHATPANVYNATPANAYNAVPAASANVYNATPAGSYSTAAPHTSSAANISSGPGAGRGLSSGPGAGRGLSSGPGAGRGLSSGPGAGRGLSSGPGRGRGIACSGPGRAKVEEAPKVEADSSITEMDNLISQLGISVPDVNVGGSSAGGAAKGPSAMSGPGANNRGVIKPAAVGPDGAKLTFNGPACFACGNEIIGKFYSASGNKYHPECFVCCVCGCEINETTGFGEDQNGKIYCENDFNELNAPRCEVCKRPIVDTCIKIGERVWHPDHFVCTSCGARLRGKPYREDEGFPYCPPCKELRNKKKANTGELCAQCKKPITGEYIILNGQKIHIEHFRCEICHSEFLGGNFREYENKRICLDCFAKVAKTICFKCKKPIIGRTVTALGNVYHPECFCCTVCGDLFAKGSYYEHDGLPYCFFHYNQLFGKVCCICDKVIASGAINFAEKFYHEGCFKCHGCNCQLNLKSHVSAVDDRPMCTKCFDKLPKEVRDRVIKRKKEEEKRAKEQKKLEKAEAKAEAKKKKK